MSKGADKHLSLAGRALLLAEGFREVDGDPRGGWRDVGGQYLPWVRALELAERDKARREGKPKKPVTKTAKRLTKRRQHA